MNINEHQQCAYAMSSPFHQWVQHDSDQKLPDADRLRGLRAGRGEVQTPQARCELRQALDLSPCRVKD